MHFKFSIFTSTLFKLRKIWNGLKKKAGFQLISTGKPKECVTLCLYFLNETCLSTLHLWRERSDNHPNVGTLHSILYSNFYIWRINFTKRKIRNRLESLQSEWKKKKIQIYFIVLKGLNKFSDRENASKNVECLIRFHVLECNKKILLCFYLLLTPGR